MSIVLSVLGMAASALPFILKHAPAAARVIQAINSEYTAGKISEAEANERMAIALANADAEIVERQSQVVIAETNAEDWLTRNWRPIVALTAFFSYFYVIIVYPHFFAWGWVSKVGFGEVGLENLFTLTAICVGGYIGGRSVEKVIDKIVKHLGRRS